MSALMQEMQARLDAVLSAPTGRHRVAELARERAKDGRPNGVLVKQAAVTEATAKATDETTGAFVALVATWCVDRQGERFVVGAWDRALATLRENGRPLPVLYSHAVDHPDSVIGLAMPNDLWVDAEGLWLRGQIDTGDQTGRRIWRMVQRGALAWSVGFRGPKKRRRADGVVEISEVAELLEVSATPCPANPKTRTTGAKSVHQAPTMADLRDREHAMGLFDRRSRDPASSPWPATEDPDTRRIPSHLERIRQGMHDEMVKALGGPIDPLLGRARRVEREFEDQLALERLAERARLIEAEFGEGP